MGDDFEVIFQRRAEPPVAAIESGQNIVEGLGHLVIGQGEDPLHDTGRPGFAVAHHLLAGKEQPGDDASRIGAQP